MAGFRKAKAEQAALKIGLYGKAGSGKTFTSLLIGEGLAKHDGKRLAMVDTERGSDFYALHVADRKVHPEAFDFDALYSRGMMEVLRECTSLSPKQYSCVIIDSMTHLWNVCIDAYTGKKGPDGQIPLQAWGKIKKPYKDLMQWMLSTTMHVIICGRQGIDYGMNADSDDLEVRGYKMKAEGETGYEPHVLIRLEEVRQQNKESITTAYVEKDRTGTLQGKAIQWPNFDKIAKPMLSLLGKTQAAVDADAAALADAEARSIDEGTRAVKSEKQRDEFLARFMLAKTKAEVEQVSKEITAQLKKEMLAEHVTELRDKYQERLNQISA
jgi:hypothetical protein